MTNKNKFNDEYQFPAEEFVDQDLQVEIPADQEPALDVVETLEEPTASGMGAIWANHKRMIMIVGAVAAITLVFGVMRMMHHKPEVVPAPVAQSAPQQPATVIEPVVDPQMTEQLTGLKQDSINNAVIIRQLQRQVQQLDSSLSQSRMAQQQLNQSMMVLVGQLQKLTDEVKTLSHPKPVKVQQTAKPVEPVLTFQLRAIVPGRAWIVGSDGQSHSIAVGDKVPQYGNVQHINADEGVVITTSGKTIRF